MFHLWHYLRFLFRSTNQHGVHSPFVFRYLTQCLYRKYRGRYSRFEKILLKSIPYFKYTSLLMLSEGNELSSLLKREFPELSLDQHPYDLVVVGRGKLAELNFSSLHAHCHNKTMIILEGIHGNSSDLARWNSLREDPRISVSIDYFFGGILFLRQEQAKQHFRIRI